MQIESGQCFAARNHTRRACDIPQEIFQRRLAFNNDICAAPGNQWNVTDKLKRIAKTLLGVQQNCFAFDRTVVEPQRRRKVSPVARPIGLAPAPFVVLPSGFEFSKAQPDQARAVMRISTLGLDGSSSGIAREPLPEPVQRPQRQALVNMKLRQCRRDGKRALVAGKRRRRTAEPHEQTAAFVERAEIAGISRKHRLVSSERLLVALEVLESARAIGGRVEIIGVDRKHRVKAHQRFLVARKRLKNNPIIVEHFGGSERAL